MRRSLLLGFLAALTGGLALGFAGPVATTGARDTAPALAQCTFTPLSFTITGAGTAEERRPISIAEGDTVLQFVALEPLTATISSTAELLVNGGFSGAVTGGLSGSFAMQNLNGVALTQSTQSAEARGYQLNEIVITGATGTITGVLAYDFYSTTATPPYYPRVIGGHVHSTATSGSYAGYRFAGYLTGYVSSVAGIPTITGAVAGRLYTGWGSLNEVLAGPRQDPPPRAVTFSPADVIAQFTRPDFAAGETAGHFNPGRTFVGTALGTIDGGFLLEHNALVVDSGPNAARGWLAGEFTFSDTSGDILYGPWLGDLTGAQMSAYLFQAAGTGVYSDSLLFGTANGTIFGTVFTGSMSGIYCEGSALPTATPGPSMTPTGIATATSPPTATQGVATPTSTACTVTFTDVPVTDPFYANIRCLACRGILGGYADGTFRPYNNITRGQIAKVVSNAAGFQEPVSGQTFTDVPASNPFYEWIERLAARGIMGGYTCGGPGEPCDPQNRAYFRWGADATRGQLSKIVANAAGFNEPVSGQTFTDVPPTNPFYAEIERLASRGIMGGYNCGGVGEPCDPQNRPYFRWAANVTRGQASKIVANTFFPGCVTPSR